MQRTPVTGAFLLRALTASLVLLACVAFGTSLRIDAALGDPNFDPVHPEGLLKSDPALLFYITERIVESGGSPYPGIRADPLVQHPEATDVIAEFAVGQEFLAAWAYHVFGGDQPLHTFCLRFFALLASLSVIGAFGLAWELSQRLSAAALAAALFTVLPLNYRTIGFVLVREDLAFPILAVHLWLFARSCRLRTRTSALLAGLTAAGALATWHASGFFVALELAVLLAWFLRSGASPLSTGIAAWGLVPVGLAGLCVPALASSRFFLSLPVALAIGLILGGLTGRRLVGLGSGIAVLGIGWCWSLAHGPSAYAHVVDLVIAKVAHVGRLPADPSELSFDARLLWQGPFETLDLAVAWAWNGYGVALGLLGTLAGALEWKREGRGAEACLAGLVILAIGSGWLIERTSILAGLLLAVSGAIFATRIRRRAVAIAIVGLVVVLQASRLQAFSSGFGSEWYRPPWRQREIAALIEWARTGLPPGEAILGDFVNSTALLAHGRHPIVLQPKYETDASRRRAEDFFTTFFRGTPQELASLMRERFQCRFLLVDRFVMGGPGRYAGGLQAGAPLPPGSPAASFLAEDEASLTSVPGFTLVHRSSATILRSGGEPSDFFRVYRLDG